MEMVKNESKTNYGGQVGINNGTIEIHGPSDGDKCLWDLFLTDPRVDKKRIRMEKGHLFNDSCEWILNHPEFQQWQKDCNTQPLWIQDRPEKSVTMLVIGIIDELERQIRDHDKNNEEKAPHTKRPLVGYYFFEASKSDRNNATAMLRALIWLLIDQDQSADTHLRNRYDKLRSKLFDGHNAFIDLSEILLSMLEGSEPTTVYMVVDSLDECKSEDLQEALKFVDRSCSHPHVKWIISSHNEVEVEKHLDSPPLFICPSLERNGGAGLPSTRNQGQIRNLSKTSEPRQSEIPGNWLGRMRDGIQKLFQGDTLSDTPRRRRSFPTESPQAEEEFSCSDSSPSFSERDMSPVSEPISLRWSHGAYPVTEIEPFSEITLWGEDEAQEHGSDSRSITSLSRSVQGETSPRAPSPETIWDRDGNPPEGIEPW